MKIVALFPTSALSESGSTGLFSALRHPFQNGGKDNLFFRIFAVYKIDAIMFMDEDLFIDFLKVKEILWTGINFSRAKFTCNGFNFSQEIMQHYLNDWNMLILNDQKKYDIRMSFRKPIMQYDLSAVTKINKNIKIVRMLTQHIDIKDIISEDEIKEYYLYQSFPQNVKYSLALLVESFDTDTKTASIWVVIVENTTSQVVLCEKFLKKPGGFGTRNYWARTFYNLLFDVKSQAFMRWENMVQNKIENDAHTAELLHPAND